MTIQIAEYDLPSLNEGLNKKFSFTATPAMMKSFADISGDINPVHTDIEFANSKGHERLVVYGGLLVAQISKMIGMHLPGRDALWNNLNINFLRPLYVGQTAEVFAEVIHVSESTSSIELKVKILVNNKTVAKATAGVMVLANNA